MEEELLSRPSAEALTKIFEHMVYRRSNLTTLPEEFCEANYISTTVYELNQEHMRFVLLGDDGRTAVSTLLSRFPVLTCFREYVIASMTTASNSVKLLINVPEIYAVEMNQCAKVGRFAHLNEDEFDYDPFIFTYFHSFEEIEFFHQAGVSQPGFPPAKHVGKVGEMISSCMRAGTLRKLKDPQLALAECSPVLNGYHFQELNIYPEAIEFLEKTDCTLTVDLLHLTAYFWKVPNVFHKIKTEDIMIYIKTRFDPGPDLIPNTTVSRVNVYVEYTFNFEHLFAFCAKTFPNLDSLVCKSRFNLNIIGAYDSLQPLNVIATSVNECLTRISTCEACMVAAKKAHKQKAHITFQIAVWWPTHDLLPGGSTPLAKDICEGMLYRFNAEYSTTQTTPIDVAAPAKELPNGVVRRRFFDNHHVMLESNC